jgi:hypothetical protein
VAELLAAFADFAVLTKDAVHGADRAVVDAFIEQTGVDLGRRLICEARRMQQIQHHLLLRIAQCPGRLRSLVGDRRRCGQAGTTALHAATRDPKRSADRGGHAAGGCECHDSLGQGSPSLGPSGMPSSAATFLRNNHLGGVPIRLMQYIPQRFRAPLEIAEDTLPVALFIVRRAGIGVGHAVPKHVVE